MKAVILEDESLIAKELQNKIQTVANDITVVEVLPSLKTARKWFMQNAEPDLLFMDIQLSDGVSFELFETFNLGCPVIFTTAYDEYAVRAFKVNGVDYLLKPVEQDELEHAFKMAEERQQNNSTISLESLLTHINKKEYRSRFLLPYRDGYK